MTLVPAIRRPVVFLKLERTRRAGAPKAGRMVVNPYEGHVAPPEPCTTRTCTIRVSVCVVLGQQPLTQGSVHYTQGALNSLRLNPHSESGQQSR